MRAILVANETSVVAPLAVAVALVAGVMAGFLVWVQVYFNNPTVRWSRRVARPREESRYPSPAP
jgi:hypothetical protein